MNTVMPTLAPFQQVLPTTAIYPPTPAQSPLQNKSLPVSPKTPPVFTTITVPDSTDATKEEPTKYVFHGNKLVPVPKRKRKGSHSSKKVTFAPLPIPQTTTIQTPMALGNPLAVIPRMVDTLVAYSAYNRLTRPAFVQSLLANLGSICNSSYYYVLIIANQKLAKCKDVAFNSVVFQKDVFWMQDQQYVDYRIIVFEVVQVYARFNGFRRLQENQSGMVWAMVETLLRPQEDWIADRWPELKFTTLPIFTVLDLCLKMDIVKQSAKWWEIMMLLHFYKVKRFWV
ncbi:unnamed protein product [Ambrosiozyma monospora]|uniref:Unnamed protein product n=1 Tax=Ambrosiozyma monospora TaxID=43982 RepID=A0ACB5SXM0_AMBMO|nr:unnamed protein product [Ambrosiozyma monospora]